MDLTSGQQLALKAIDEVKKTFPDGGGIVIISGYAGTGKALAFDQFVQTPLGPKIISQLKKGDFVFGQNGKPTRVEGVYPQGVRQSYRVTFRDGVSVECDEEHLWSVWTHKLRAQRKELRVLSLKEIAMSGLRFPSGPYKYSVPQCEPVEYPEQSLPIDPYLLGLSLGDGTSLGKTPTLCLPFSEIELPERFIPQAYLMASSAQRLSLLQGLMDTDGCATGNRIRFCTHSPALARGVVTLVQSLGGTAIAKKDKRGAWNINVKMFVNPFRLQRKASLWRFSTKNPPSRHIFRVEPTRKCEHVCIKVANEDGLFLTEGFVVTHNTTLFRILAEDEKLTVVAPTGKAALRASEVAPVNALTVHRWLYEVAEDPKTGKLVTALKSDVEVPENKTLFVDEASMVTYKMFKDLYETCKLNKMNLVFIGDGFQLPPVEFDEKYRDFSVLASDAPCHYRVNMTEVVRQALDSPIIRASMQVRDMRSDLQALSDLPVIRTSDLAKVGAEVFQNDGATICHKNTTRHELNNSIRQELGITQEKVQKGEPLMVLLNNYELDVYNGEIITVLDEPKLLGDKPVVVTDRFANESMNMWYYGTRIDTPLGAKRVLFADREVFGSSGKISTKSIRRAGMDLSRHLKLKDMRAEGAGISYQELQEVKGNEVVNCNLGYALTSHKAQGSEFPQVLVVIENSVRLHSQEGRRWVYTSLTRAKKDVKLCWL